MCRKTRLFGNRLVVNLCKPKYKMYRWLLVMLVIVGYVTFITVSAAGGAPGSGTMNKSEQSQKYRQLIHEALARYEALHNDKNPAGGVKEVARVKRQTGGETAPACVAFRTQDPNHLANGEYLVDDTLTDCAGDGQRPRYRHKLRSQYLYFYRDNIFNVNRWVQYSSVSCLPFSSFFCDATTKSPAGLPSSCWKEGFLGISVPATVSTCADACVSDPCQHGTCNGVFTTQQNTYTCTCDRGWKGTNCDQVVCDSAAVSCVHGTCDIDEDNKAVCACEEGYAGEKCDQKDPCSPNPCRNRGTCRATGISTVYSCQCELGWTGQNCTLDDFLNPLVIIDRSLGLLGLNLAAVDSFFKGVDNLVNSTTRGINDFVTGTFNEVNNMFLGISKVVDDTVRTVGSFFNFFGLAFDKNVVPKIDLDTVKTTSPTGETTDRTPDKATSPPQQTVTMPIFSELIKVTSPTTSGATTAKTTPAPVRTTVSTRRRIHPNERSRG